MCSRHSAIPSTVLVAVKVLKEEFCRKAGFVEHFKMEAQAAACLAHPNIVNVYDVIDEGDLHTSSWN